MSLSREEIRSALDILREPHWPRAEATVPTKTPPLPTARREEFPRRQPCFHCSRSLQKANGGRPATYLGFVLNVDGFDRVLHKACVADFVAGVAPVEMEAES